MSLSSIFTKIFGSRNSRQIKQYGKIVKQVNSFEESMATLSDNELTAYTPAFKDRLSKGETLDDILPEAFSLVREVSKRAMGMRHFDVQIIGGISLHNGKIPEMRTGEGKTLTATLAAYLNALNGKGVHIVTVNDYLAHRDAKWMSPIYSMLGLTVGVVVHSQDKQEKRAAYAADITYGTNNEFGFDYLRDNMAFERSDKVQRDLNFAIVDEVDSILIDEARTPLIISGADQDSSDLYIKINKIVPYLTRQQENDGPGDFSVDEKSKQAFLTDDGHEHIEELLQKENLLSKESSLYDADNISLMHHVYAALRAHSLFRKDVDYIVKNSQVVIVDEHTGRTMPGRRWSDGLHQAMEAKEGVPIQNENQTLASITFQNYFRLYNKLSGMTGTADTEAFELSQIYGLDVLVVPTNKPNRRDDLADLIYLTQEEKFEAIIQDIEDCVVRNQPTLVGTISIETSEYLSRLLKQKGIEHRVLNAKFHQQEANIIAEAGRPGKVTIATNMAGRGTDIVLGGNLQAEFDSLSETDANNPEVKNKLEQEWQQRHDIVIKAGGLHIIGTERHESRRIDNQLRGRSGRQGDPGSTRFYLSVKDNLMRIFISDGVSKLLNKLGMEKGEAITHSLVTRAVENAQRKVEGHNFDIRKQLLEFDDVANDQRKVIYIQRNELMAASDIADTIKEIRNDVLTNIIAEYIPPNSLEEMWDVSGLDQVFSNEFSQHLDLQSKLDKDSSIHEEQLIDLILNHFTSEYQKKEEKIGSETLRHLEKVIMLNVLDSNWKEHLANMDYLRQSIHLRGYAQKDPKQEYKRESFAMFTNMLESIKREVISLLTVVHIKEDSTLESIDQMRTKDDGMQVEYRHDQPSTSLEEPESNSNDNEELKMKTFMRDEPKVGRNQPCPCGSGKKYKYCHGAVSSTLREST